MDPETQTEPTHDEPNPNGRLTWIAIGFLWVIGLALGFLGLAQYARSTGQSLSVLDLLYRLLQLFTLESGAVSPPIPLSLEIARFGLPVLAAWTVVRAAMHLFREQARRIALFFWRNHVIIAGLSAKGFRLATELVAAGRKVVVIEPEASHPLKAACRKQGILVIEGDASNPADLESAQLRHSGVLIAVTGDDAANTEVAATANELIRRLYRPPLHCIVHIVNPGMWNLLRNWEVVQERFESLRLDLFNAYQRGADSLIEEFDLASATAEDEAVPPHLLIVGLRPLSEHLLIQAARKWFHTRTQQDKLGIVVLDPQAAEKLELLAARYPALRESAELIPVPIKIDSAEFEKGEFLDNKVFELALIDLPDDDQSLAAALTVKGLMPGRSTPVAIQMTHSGGIYKLLEMFETGGSNEPHLRPFTLVERVCDRHFMNQGTHERLARALHQAYLENRRKSSTWDDGDPALARWDKLPLSIQNSNREQADFIGRILRKYGYELTLLRDWCKPAYQFSEAEVEELAQSEHERWRNQRLSQGWRYAPGPKNDSQRTHPDLVDWNDLPEVEKEKNRVFVRNWPFILHQTGFMITPS